MKLKPILNSLIYYILPILLILLSIGAKGKHLFNELGQISEYLLIVIILSKPLCIIFNSKILAQIVAFRRQLGVASFWTFFFHTLGLIYLFNLTNPAAYFNLSGSLFYGSLAGIGMLILIITSNEYSVRFLKNNWKKLQYLAYPTFLLALYHIGLAQNEMTDFYIFGSAFVVLKVLGFVLSKLRKKTTLTTIK